MANSERMVTVTWTTTIEEVYTAEIPKDEYDEMIDSGTFSDDLAQYEDEPSDEVSVTSRDITEASA